MVMVDMTSVSSVMLWMPSVMFVMSTVVTWGGYRAMSGGIVCIAIFWPVRTVSLTLYSLMLCSTRILDLAASPSTLLYYLFQ